MARKSEIRKRIERILGHKYDTCYIDSRKGKVVKSRMKFGFSKPATQKQIDQIMKLPGVVRVGFTNKGHNNHHHYYPISGVTIHFSTSHPSLIKLN